MGNTALQVPIAKISTAVTSLADCSQSAAMLYKYMAEKEMGSVWAIWSDNTDKLLRAVRDGLSPDKLTGYSIGR